MSIQHYKTILRALFDINPMVPQTARGMDGLVVTSLTPTYLCLQCPSTLTEDDLSKHGSKKSHRFCTFALCQQPHGWKRKLTILSRC